MHSAGRRHKGGSHSSGMRKVGLKLACHRFEMANICATVVACSMQLQARKPGDGSKHRQLGHVAETGHRSAVGACTSKLSSSFQIARKSHSSAFITSFYCWHVAT